MVSSIIKSRILVALLGKSLKLVEMDERFRNFFGIVPLVQYDGRCDVQIKIILWRTQRQSQTQLPEKLLVHFSINIASLYVLSWPKLNFGYHLTFEIILDKFLWKYK